VRFQTLGPLEVFDDTGHRVALPAAKERLLLWLLLAAPSRVASMDHLIDALWEGQPPATAVTTLRSYVSRLRKALGDADRIEARPTGYLLLVAPEELDALRFESLLGRAREAAGSSGSGAVERYREALELWHGPAFAEVADREWARGVAARLDTARLSALEELFEAELSLGRHREVLGEIELAGRADPLHERFWALRMLALYRCGRQADALRAYQDLRHLLADELGLDPTPALARLEQSILDQDPGLDRVERQEGGGSRDGVGSAQVAVVVVAVPSPGPLAERLGAGWPAVLARGQALLGLAFEAAAGTVVAWRGTRATVRFADLVDAVDGGVQALRAVAADAELAEAGFAVALGAAEGEAVMAGGTLVGLVVAHAGALADVAHGGQLLVTRDVTGPAARTVAVGTYRLDAFPGPVAVHRVLADGLVDEPARPDAPDFMDERLPSWPSPLVGREADLQSLAGVAGVVPLLTVVGAGGCGKTRLGVELARRRGPAFADGAWFIDLAALDADDQIASAVAVHLGLSLSQSNPVTELIGLLHGRPCLLVLDNCEHVLEGVAALADAICSGAPSVRLLATSREPIRVAAETVWRLEPLGLAGEGASAAEALDAPAVQLLLARVRAKDPTFELTEVMVEPASALVRALGGIPLAIELAAARAAIDGAAALQPISDVLHDLQGYRTGVRRQSTLETTIEWSHSLLSDPEQQLFRRLSVFRGGFTAELARSVCGEADDLPRLVDKSLVAVVHEEPARYRLYEVIAEYAAARADAAGEIPLVRERHLDVFVSLAGGHATAAQADIAAIGAEYDNLRGALGAATNTSADAALDLAASLVSYWQVRGMWTEGREWLSRALALTGGSDAGRVRCLLGLAVFGLVVGDAKQGELDAREALEIPVETALHAHALRILAATLTRQADYDAAWPIWQDSRAAAQVAADELGEADALRGLGSCAYLMGDFVASAELTRLGLDLGRKIGADGMVGSLLNNLGQALSESGALAEAQAVLEESLAMRQESGHARGQAAVLNSLAENAGRLGDQAGALANARASYQLFADLNDKELFLAAGNLALARLEVGQAEHALVLLGALAAEDLGVADHERTRFESAAERARAALDAERASAAFDHGRLIGVHAAVQYGDEASPPDGSLERTGERAALSERA
jgi:predicted ATPase/DNA-binding SARP family transcriptional activator